MSMPEEKLDINTASSLHESGMTEPTAVASEQQFDKSLSNELPDTQASRKIQDGIADWLLSDTGPSYWLMRIFFIAFVGFVLAIICAATVLTKFLALSSFAFPAAQIAAESAKLLAQLNELQSNVPHAVGGASALIVVCTYSMAQCKKMDWIHLLILIAATTVLLTGIFVNENIPILEKSVSKIRVYDKQNEVLPSVPAALRDPKEEDNKIMKRRD